MKNKVVIITGATSGIGKALAFEFASKGSKLVLVGRRAERLSALVDELGSDVALAVEADVTREADCLNVVDKAVTQFGKIDVLVNNAGISMRALFSNCELSVVQQVMGVNFWGTVYCTKYALSYLLEQRGSVVGVISIAGYLGLPGRTAYSASKFAVRGFLETLRAENRKNGLHVLVTAPGFVASEIRLHALDAKGKPQNESPRSESKMMTTEHCARKIYRAIKRRKREQIMGWGEGKFAVALSKWCPRLVEWASYRKMSREPGSPFS